MTRGIPWTLRPGVLLLLVAFVASVPARVSKVDGLLARGWRAGDEGRWAEAERAFAQARELAPDKPDIAARHAGALARLGKRDEALGALTEAARLGYASPYEPRGDDAFAAIRSDPRFLAALEVMDKNEAAARQRVEEAYAPLPAASAPSFASFAALADAFAREERSFEPGLEWSAAEIQQRTRCMRKLAALERYLTEHPEARDRTEAAAEALRTWMERAGSSFTLQWRRSHARDLETHAASVPGVEARFYGIAARALAAETDEPPRGLLVPPPKAGCEGGLEALRAMATDPESGPWGTRAEALEAVCLDALGRATPDALRAAQMRWKSAGLHDSNEALSLRMLDNLLHRSMVAASLRTLGAPDFALTSSRGDPVTVHGLHGKVVLVNFWSPG